MVCTRVCRKAAVFAQAMEDIPRVTDREYDVVSSAADTDLKVAILRVFLGERGPWAATTRLDNFPNRYVVRQTCNKRAESRFISCEWDLERFGACCTTSSA